MSYERKGFQEGTQSVTTGDPMKEGDHRRHRSFCDHYYKGHCRLKNMNCFGSSHCDEYNDGREDFIIDTKVNYNHEWMLFNSFLEELALSIPCETLEGYIIKKKVMDEHGVTKADIEEKKNQYNTYIKARNVLKMEIDEHNTALKAKCKILGHFLISKYNKEKRDFDEENRVLYRNMIDSHLKSKVESFFVDYDKYEKAEKKPLKNAAKKNVYYNIGAISYNNESYGDAFFNFKKSILNYEIEAMFSIAKILFNEKKYKFDMENIIYLILYASYMGNKEASNYLGKKLLANNPNSKSGQAFIAKSKQN